MVGIALSNTPIFRALDGYQKIVRPKVRLKKSSRVGFSSMCVQLFGFGVLCIGCDTPKNRV